MSERAVLITDAEWHRFQQIPEQGYSHRYWIDWLVAGRVADLQEKLAEHDAEQFARLLADLEAAIVESRAAYARGYRAADRYWQQAKGGSWKP